MHKKLENKVPIKTKLKNKDLKQLEPSNDVNDGTDVLANQDYDEHAHETIGLNDEDKI